VPPCRTEVDFTLKHPLCVTVNAPTQGTGTVMSRQCLRSSESVHVLEPQSDTGKVCFK
jgi:hypothetical protein